MFTFAHRPSLSSCCARPRAGFLAWWWLCAGAALFVLSGEAAILRAGSDFGKDIELAPFRVNGKSFSVSIHARTKADRRDAEKFADDVIEVAYETLGHSTGKGLIIAGADGEPHPILILRKFLTMAQAGQLDPSLGVPAGKLDELLKKLQEKVKIQDDPDRPTGITFETFMPALPMPLEGVASKLYQLAWAEGFDDARLEQKFKSLTREDLARDELSHYDWVFYLPPRSVTAAVFKDMLNKGMKGQKMGLFKRAALRSAVFVFSPLVKKGLESMQEGILYMTILRAEGGYNEGDIDALTRVYVRELMPALKPRSGSEHHRVLAAIEQQKMANADYAKDPFVKPARLATFDPAAYAPFEGEYTSEPPKVTHWFKREGDSFEWNYKNQKPRIFYPAGDRLLVNEDGSMTIRFLVDSNGIVTGVEERWVRRRQTIARKS
jgi:hypothetical protein